MLFSFVKQLSILSTKTDFWLHFGYYSQQYLILLWFGLVKHTVPSSIK